jgi:WD40 repeat protein
MKGCFRFLILSFISFVQLLSYGQLSVELQTGNKKDITCLDFHPTDSYLLSVDSDNTLVIWDYRQRKQYSSTHFLGLPTIQNAVFLQGQLLVVSSGNQLNVYDFQKDEVLLSFFCEKEINNVQFRLDTLYVSAGYLYKMASPNLDVKIHACVDTSDMFSVSNHANYITRVEQNTVKLYTYDGKMVNEIKKTPQQIIDVEYDELEKILSVVGDQAIVRNYWLDGERLKKNSIQVNTRIWNRYNVIRISGNHLIAGDQNDVVSVLDLTTGKIIQQTKNHGGKVLAMAVSEHAQLLAVGGEGGWVQLYDVKERNKSFAFQSLSPSVTCMAKGSENSVYFLGYDNGQLKMWDFETNQINTFKPPASKMDKWMKTVYHVTAIDSVSAVLKRTRTGQVQSNSDKVKYYKVEWENELKEVKLSALKKYKESPLPPPFSQIIEGNRSVNVLSYSRITDSLALAGMDNGFLYWLDNDNRVVLKSFSPRSNDFFHVTPDNYYYASKTALSYVGAKFNGQLVGFEQIDLMYNRPDMVLQTLPYYTIDYILLLKRAYEKRLEKMNLVVADGFSSLSLPQCISSINTIPLNTNEVKHAVTIKAESSDSPLKALHVLVNGVPLYGKFGLPILGHLCEKEIEIVLATGENVVQLFVENQKGLESLRQQTQVMVAGKYTPSLHVLTIGSGNFADAKFNLKYAAKDAQDVANYFSNATYFKEVKMNLITDQEVNRDNVVQAISSLNLAHIEDVIIVFYAGHGVLDVNLDYYLSTYGMDFTYPQESGISFEDFEYQLSLLPCRNKLLLIDACHSGEIDKNEVYVASHIATEENEELQFRSGLLSIGVEGSQSIFQLSKTIFADLRKNSGVITISSAGADEYALEGGKWKNGAFTWCLLDGLSSGAVDENKNGQISVSELQHYLFEKVPQMTNGKQTPTSRVEIVGKDFRVF